MTIEDIKIGKETSNLDLTRVDALQQKRTLAFVNHFVISTVQFLNNFMRNCEQKLMQFERRLEHINANVVLLEDRLTSIPEVNTHTVDEEITPTPDKSTEAENTAEQSTTESQPQTEKSKPAETYPEYDRFIKMVHVGVPLQAVKLKVALEGLDPNVLESIMK